MKEKLASLEKHIAGLGSVLVAYSGGVDSTFLAAVAQRALGDNSLAVTVDMEAVPDRLVACAVRHAETIGIRHRVVPAAPLSVPDVCRNDAERCYYCKRHILSVLRSVAEEEGISHMIDGGNLDDAGDYRPGSKAVTEAGVLSPLKMLKWTKNDIRAASRLLGLDTADDPSYSCLMTRIPYGSEITDEKLRQIDAVEEWLDERGFRGYRARHHGDLVRLELSEEDIIKLLGGALRVELVAKARAGGFDFVTVDLEPYRRGRLNESL